MRHIAERHIIMKSVRTRCVLDSGWAMSIYNGAMLLDERRNETMPKMYKSTNARETMCKDLHMKMNLAGNPTKLVQPNLFMIVDTDGLQKQVNRLENEMNHMKRAEARRRWRRK